MAALANSGDSSIVRRVEGREPHPEALVNYERAILPESKLRYPLRDADKRRPFESLGFSEAHGNWEELGDQITVGFPLYPSNFIRSTRWGDIYRVDMVITGPAGKQAPVRTGWIYRTGEDFPRLITLYVKTTEWRRTEREGTIEP